MSESEPGAPITGTTRRDVLKKGAVAGAVVWTAPVVLSRPAGAQTAGSPCPHPQSGQGTGFDSTGNIDAGPFGQSSGGEDCAVNVDATPVPLTASVICGSYDPDTGTAASHVVGLNLSAPIEITDLTVATTSTTECDCTHSGTMVVTSGSIEGNPITIPAPPPNTVLISDQIPLGLNVVLNEQVCEGDDFVVRAVHVYGTLVGLGTVVDIKVAESRSRADGCDCDTQTPL